QAPIEVAVSQQPKPSAVVFVADVRRMTTFYRELASMSVLHEDADHAVLEVAGFQLVVHRLAGEPRVHADPNGRLRVRHDSYLKMCFPVARIDDARTKAAALGGLIEPREKEWEARGFRACDGHDPEGNVIQVREKAM